MTGIGLINSQVFNSENLHRETQACVADFTRSLLQTYHLCLPQIRMLKPNLHCDGFRKWELWKAMVMRGGVLMDGICVLINETPKSSLTFPTCEDTVGRGPSMNQEVSSLTALCVTESVWQLDLGLPSIQNCEKNKFLCFISYPVNCILLEQLKWTKTTTH